MTTSDHLRRGDRVHYIEHLPNGDRRCTGIGVILGRREVDPTGWRVRCEKDTTVHLLLDDRPDRLDRIRDFDKVLCFKSDDDEWVVSVPSPGHPPTVHYLPCFEDAHQALLDALALLEELRSLESRL